MRDQRPQFQYNFKINLYRGIFTITLIGVLATTIVLFWLPQPLKAQIIKNQITTDHVLYDVAWSPDGELIAAGAKDGIGIYRGDTLEEIAYLPAISMVSVSWRPDSILLATAGGFGENQGTILIWRRDPKNVFTLEQTLQNGHYQTWAVTWSPDGSQLATIGSDGQMDGGSILYNRVEFWSTNTWTKTAVSPDEYLNLTSALEWSPDGSLVAVGGTLQCNECYGMYRPNGYFILNPETGGRVRYIQSMFEPGTLSWSQDGKLAVDNPNIAIVDPLTGNLINDLGGLGAYQLEWRSDNIWLASARSGFKD